MRSKTLTGLANRDSLIDTPGNAPSESCSEKSGQIPFALVSVQITSRAELRLAERVLLEIAIIENADLSWGPGHYDVPAGQPLPEDNIPDLPTYLNVFPSMLSFSEEPEHETVPFDVFTRPSASAAAEAIEEAKAPHPPTFVADDIQDGSPLTTDVLVEAYCTDPGSYSSNSSKSESYQPPPTAVARISGDKAAEIFASHAFQRYCQWMRGRANNPPYDPDTNTVVPTDDPTYLRLLAHLAKLKTSRNNHDISDFPLSSVPADEARKISHLAYKWLFASDEET